MSFKEGDRVKAVDDIFEGKIVAVLGGGMFKVLCDGFEYRFMQHEIIKVLEEDEVEIHQHISRMKLRAKDIQLAKSPKSIKESIQRNDRGVMEVDLHLHELIDNEKGLEARQKIQIQLDHSRKAIEKARSIGEKRLVLIHGVGEGVLRTEIRQLLDHLPGLQYHDAPYRLYGYGATEVEF